MKVLFQSYNNSFQNPSGGVQNRMRRIYELLCDKGVTVDYFNPFSSKVIDYDLMHVFMLEEENYNLIRYCKEKHVPVVISTITSLSAGKKIDIYKKIINRLHLSTTYQRIIYSAELADALIVETPKEASFIERHFGIDKNKIHVIANGVETFVPGDNSIYNEIGEIGDYVLHIGRFDKNKNQLNVIKALRNTNIPLVLIGGPSEKSEDYFNECKRLAEGSNNIIFLGWVDHDSSLFKSAITHANTLILSSYNETFGLVILEGAMAGLNIAASSQLPILDFESMKTVSRFNPSQPKSIYEAIECSFKRPKSNALKEAVIREFSWESIIDAHIALYNQIMKK